MSIKYIYDSKGKKTGVIIPIELWDSSKSKILKGYQENKGKKRFKPPKYRGIYHNLNPDVDKEARKLRDEWKYEKTTC